MMKSTSSPQNIKTENNGSDDTESVSQNESTLKNDESQKTNSNSNHLTASEIMVTSSTSQSSSPTTSSPKQPERSKRIRRITPKFEELLVEETMKKKGMKQEKKASKQPSRKRKNNSDVATAAPKKRNIAVKTKNGDDSSSSSLDDKNIICCICNCGVDFSEKEVFAWTEEDEEKATSSKKKNEEQIECSSKSLSENDELNEDDVGKNFISKDEACSLSQTFNSSTKNSTYSDDESSIPYLGVKLPKSLYDSNNALIICETPGCNRCYHQRCHFVPVLCLPRGAWHCLICRLKDEIVNSSKKKRGSSRPPPKKKSKTVKQNKKKKSSSVTLHDTKLLALSKPLTVDELNLVYLSHHDISDGVSKCKRKDESEISVQERFEYQSASLKSAILYTEIKKRIKSTINISLSTVRLESHTIRGFTETERAKKSLIADYERSKRVPQQLIQSVDRAGQSKMRIRELMKSIDSVIRNKNDRKILEEWYMEQARVSREGTKLNNPKLPEIVSLESSSSNVPSQSTEVTEVDWDFLESKLFVGEPIRCEPRFDLADYDGDIEVESDEDEDLTEKIKCSVCWSGHTEAENDVLMCDGKDCFRAFHMKCCNPVVTQQMLDDDPTGTWFCAYCCTLANAIHYTQDEYLGDEVDDISIKSWEEANDVFPEAKMEIDAAKLWKQGKNDRSSKEYLNSLLGIQLHSNNEEIDQDDEDDSDDESFQSYSSQNKHEEMTVSSTSSNSSLSVNHWEIDKSEIEALSSCSSAEEYGSELDEKQSSRRARSVRQQNDVTIRANDVGTIDMDNIMRGKRNRTKVDYRRLNDSMFGEADEIGENTELDDKQEYINSRKRKRSDSSSSSDDTSHSSQDDSDDDERSDDESSNSDSMSAKNMSKMAKGKFATKAAKKQKDKNPSKTKQKNSKRKAHATGRTSRSRLANTNETEKSSKMSKKKKKAQTSKVSAKTKDSAKRVKNKNTVTKKSNVARSAKRNASAKSVKNKKADSSKTKSNVALKAPVSKAASSKRKSIDATKSPPAKKSAKKATATSVRKATNKNKNNVKKKCTTSSKTNPTGSTEPGTTLKSNVATVKTRSGRKSKPVDRF